ncbi:MAG: response regulator transcription factor [Chloroflexi bacterium]|nr:response regulator transcription factor [Chloroflexota bacterium]
MSDRRVLIISSHPLFAEGIERILQEDGNLVVVARSRELEDALPLMQDHQPDTIIIDNDEPGLQDAEVVNLLVGNQAERQVIFLTLSGSRMIVYHRQRVEDATPEDLLSMLRTHPTRPNPEGTVS